jgi:hypothetical protein
MSGDVIKSASFTGNERGSKKDKRGKKWPKARSLSFLPFFAPFVFFASISTFPRRTDFKNMSCLLLVALTDLACGY